MPVTRPGVLELSVQVPPAQVDLALKGTQRQSKF